MLKSPQYATRDVNKHSKRTGNATGVRTAQHTYCRNIWGKWLLYDNEVDPYQLDNLIDNSGQSREKALVYSTTCCVFVMGKQLGETLDLN